MVFYYGGPSHIDTLDPKPDAPAEIRGEFRPIPTSAPGMQICEHLPRLARVMHKVALVRSVTHAAALHDSAAIHALTGRPLDGPDRELFAPLPQFYPSHGSAVAALRTGPPAEVSFATLPFPFRNVHEVPCQGGGFLGPAFDPFRVECDPDKVLWWDRDGLAIFYKRLEEGSYSFPAPTGDASQIEMTAADLQLVLQGIDPTKVKRTQRYQKPAAVA